MEAYVLIECASGKAAEALKKIAKIKGVECAQAVTGPYDIIAYVEYKNEKELGNIVVKRIQSVKGVAKTTTCMAVSF